MQLGVPDAETVASHSFEAAVLALELASAVEADPEKAAVLALIHDLPEAVMGDIPKWTSSRMASIDIEAAMEIESKEILKLVSEFSDEKTREAKVAKLCDLISTNIQARRYLRIGYDAARIEEETRKQIFRMLENVELKPLSKKVESLMGF